MELRVRYVVVGFFTLVVALAGIAFALWIQNRGSLHGRQAMVVHFEGPAPGLRVGAPVTFNGVRVGEVTGLTFDPSDPAAVNARIAVDSTTPVTASTSATRAASTSARGRRTSAGSRTSARTTARASNGTSTAASNTPSATPTGSTTSAAITTPTPAAAIRA